MEVLELHPSIFKHYQDVSNRTFLRDLEELIRLNVLIKDRNTYRANIDILGGFVS